MKRLLFVAVILAAVAFPLSAQNNCTAFKCYNPPPYNCPFCGQTMYNGGSSCTLTDAYSGSGTSCFVSGSCNTGMGDECPSGSCGGPDQQWTRWLNPRPLTDEWALVRVKLVPGPRRRNLG
jgi:hypothetical protein